MNGEAASRVVSTTHCTQCPLSNYSAHACRGLSCCPTSHRRGEGGRVTSSHLPSSAATAVGRYDDTTHSVLPHTPSHPHRHQLPPHLPYIHSPFPTLLARNTAFPYSSHDDSPTSAAACSSVRFMAASSSASASRFSLLSTSTPYRSFASSASPASSRPPRLLGEVAAITGGSAGIGRETALLFAQEGAAGLVIVDVNEQAGQETVDLIKRQFNTKAVFVKADVSKAKDCENVSSAHIQHLPRRHRHLTFAPPPALTPLVSVLSSSLSLST